MKVFSMLSLALMSLAPAVAPTATPPAQRGQTAIEAGVLHAVLQPGTCSRYEVEARPGKDGRVILTGVGVADLEAVVYGEEGPIRVRERAEGGARVLEFTASAGVHQLVLTNNASTARRFVLTTG